jgi:hypothetical protein
MKKVLLKVLEPIRATLLVAFAIGLGIAVHPMFFLAALLIAVAAFGEGFKHRTIIGLAAILIVVAGNSSAVESAKAKEKTQTGGIQPLTYGNVVAHFKAAGLRTTEVQKRCTIFFDGEWKNAYIYNYCVIMIENSDEDVQATFYLTDAHEMNWVTEFLDAPFFAQSETQKLFGLMNSGRDVRGEKIGRFRVDFHRWQPRHAEILVFSFTPVSRRG